MQRVVGMLVYVMMAMGVYAQSWELVLSLSQDQIIMGQQVVLQLDINTQQLWWGEVQIEGIDQFTIVGQQQSTRTMMVNGATTAQQSIAITLSPKQPWTYTIWPARISGTSLVSNTVEFTVTDTISQLQAQLRGPRALVDTAWWYGLLLLGILLVWWVYWIYHRRTPVSVPQTRMVTTVDTPSPGPIDRHARKPTLDDPVYVESVEIFVRNYLQRKRQTATYAMTYQELLSFNNTTTTEKKVDMQTLKYILMQLQQAKYAKRAIDLPTLDTYVNRLLA